jgi:hypothetical protein
MPRKAQKRVVLPSWIFTINRIWIGLLFTTLLGTLWLSHNTSSAGNPVTIEGLYKCTNSIRTEHSQKRLFLSEQLNRAAFHKLVDMEEYDYWAHKNPATGAMGWEFIDRSGYYYQIAGENLAIGYPTSEEVCEAWKNSPTHFENMIDPDFQEMGFAFEEVILENNRSGILVVQLFATKAGFDKDYKTPPACLTAIDRTLRVLSPKCGIVEEQENTLTLYNPRKQAVEITVDGEQLAFVEKQKGRVTQYIFEQPFSLGSHELKIKKADKKQTKTAQIKFIVGDSPSEQISLEKPTDSYYASIFKNKSAEPAMMIMIIGLGALVAIMWKQRPKRN